jgi:hypothetical protein
MKAPSRPFVAPEPLRAVFTCDRCQAAQEGPFSTMCRDAQGVPYIRIGPPPPKWQYVERRLNAQDISPPVVTTILLCQPCRLKYEAALRKAAAPPQAGART